MTTRNSKWLTAALALLAAPVSAHHSAAMFDTKSEVSFDGVVTRYDWRNPHVYMTVRTTGPDGKAFDQEIEAGAPSVLLPLGLTADSLHAGDHVTVHANPNKHGTGHVVLGREIVKADGTTLPLFIASRSIRKPSTARADSLAGTWFAPRQGFFAFNAGRRSWVLTDKARAALKSFDIRRDATHAKCIPVTAPTLMVYPVVTAVEVRKDRVVFNTDWMSSRRIVYLDGRSHPENGPRTLHGNSIGRWEGKTLVVDTTQYADHREGTALGIPSDARKHLIERFSLSEDRRHLNYEVTMEDPTYLAKPVKFSSQWEYRPDLKPTGLACDLSVARRYLTDE